jgi:hypothetical protein
LAVHRSKAQTALAISLGTPSTEPSGTRVETLGPALGDALGRLRGRYLEMHWENHWAALGWH